MKYEPKIALAALALVARACLALPVLESPEGNDGAVAVKSSSIVKDENALSAREASEEEEMEQFRKAVAEEMEEMQMEEMDEEGGDYDSGSDDDDDYDYDDGYDDDYDDFDDDEDGYASEYASEAIESASKAIEWPDAWCEKECRETYLLYEGCKKQGELVGESCVCSVHFRYKVNKCQADGCEHYYHRSPEWQRLMEEYLEECKDKGDDFVDY